MWIYQVNEIFTFEFPKDENLIYSSVDSKPKFDQFLADTINIIEEKELDVEDNEKK